MAVVHLLTPKTLWLNHVHAQKSVGLFDHPSLRVETEPTRILAAPFPVRIPCRDKIIDDEKAVWFHEEDVPHDSSSFLRVDPRRVRAEILTMGARQKICDAATETKLFELALAVHQHAVVPPRIGPPVSSLPALQEIVFGIAESSRVL